MDTDFKRAEMSVEENTGTAGVLVPLTSEDDSTAELEAIGRKSGRKLER